MPSRRTVRPHDSRTTREPTLIEPDLLRTMPLPAYGAESAKHDRGKLLIIAGSRRLPGPAILAARAALRAGCGTVRVAAPDPVAVPIGVALPELMVVPLPASADGALLPAALPLIQAQYGACQAAVIGPGLGDDPGTGGLIRRVVIEAPVPLLVDAQALFVCGPQCGAPATGAGPRVYTPHAAEMRALTGREVDAIEADPPRAAAAFARTRKATLALKGRETVIASPTGELFRNTAGTRGLGTAGSGDTLAGIIGSLLAQGMEPTAAAVWGVYLHALAGEAAADELGEDGLLASDWVERLPTVIRAMRLKTAGG